MTITVCVGSNCHIKGSYDVINGLTKLISENKLDNVINLKASFCLGECTKAVSVKIDESRVYSVNKETLEDFFKNFIMSKI